MDVDEDVDEDEDEDSFFLSRQVASSGAALGLVQIWSRDGEVALVFIPTCRCMSGMCEGFCVSSCVYESA